MMRHPAYVQVGGRDVTVTNRDKVFFPRSGMTKGDLVDYYVAVAPAVLPHVRERVMQMLRYPNGVDGPFFYQKRVPVPHPEWLETYTIEFPSGRTADFPVVNDAAALAWIANLGCIDLHTWSSRIGDVEKPDYLLIDLDPRGGDPWSHVRTIALVVKDVMDELGLASWPKTSGSTGIHILAPIVPELPFPEVRRFAKAFAQEAERRVPDIATTTWKVADGSAGPACRDGSGSTPSCRSGPRTRSPAAPRPTRDPCPATSGSRHRACDRPRRGDLTR